MNEYELLTKAGSFTVVAIILLFLLKSYIDSNNKVLKNHEKEREEYQKLVSDVRKESSEREEKLMKQIDKCTTSLQENTESLKEISKNMQVIPTMQEELKVIPTMQADISYLKEKVK